MQFRTILFTHKQFLTEKRTYKSYFNVCKKMTEFSQLIFLIILLSDLLARFCNSNFYLNPGQMGYPWAKDLLDMQIDFKLWWQSKNLMKRRYVEGFSYLIGIISNCISILYTQGLTKVQLISKSNFGVFNCSIKPTKFLSTFLP